MDSQGREGETRRDLRKVIHRWDSERPEAAWHPDLRGQHSLAALDHTVMNSESCAFQ